MNPEQFQKDGMDAGVAHIRGTPNNPTSSRGSLFTVVDVTFESGQKGRVTVVDLAGSEDPVSMVEG